MTTDPNEAGVRASERERIAALVRALADTYRPMTRAALLDVATKIEDVEDLAVCVQCGQPQVDVRRSQDARRPVPCELQWSGTGEPTGVKWSRHRFAVPGSGS